MFAKQCVVAAGALLVAGAGTSQAQTLQKLTNQAPEILIYGFVMTDGSVLAQGGGNVGGSLAHWFKLTPDKSGSYQSGTWSQAASAPYEPYAGGGAVLGDGRLALIGGEYTGNNFFFDLTNRSAVYDPVANSWVNVPPPTAFQPGSGGFRNFGDSPTTVLPGGNLLVGQKITKRDVALDPASLSWIQYGRLQTEKRDFNAEEGWVLLPDGSILTEDVATKPHAERLIPGLRPTDYSWISAGIVPVILASPRDACCIPYDGGHRIYNPPGEIGPAMLRPDGTVFATGSFPNGGGTAGHTAVYHVDTGRWTAGPDFQPGDNAGDNFGVLEPSGNVLVEGDQAHVVESRTMGSILAKRAQAQAQHLPNVTLYEFNGTTLTPLPTKGVVPGASLLPLPSGQVLVMGLDERIFTPTGTYQQAWAPTISSAPSSVTVGSTYKVGGTQFNGLSQACAFGDEFQCATNYPLVRITNTATGHICYARTHNHSTMAVATGSKIVSTNFDVLPGTETGPSKLEVVANGIPSKPVSITVN